MQFEIVSLTKLENKKLYQIFKIHVIAHFYTNLYVNRNSVIFGHEKND